MNAAQKKGQVIYLGSNGKVFGPFTSAEFEALNLSGDIQNFSWIWDSTSDVWKPLDPAPQIKPSSGVTFLNQGTSKAIESIEVICHNFREVLSASLVRMTETGCELISKDSNGHVSHHPHFALRAPLTLNLYDPSTRKMVTVNGRFDGAERANEGWKLRVRWDAIPTL